MPRNWVLWTREEDGVIRKWHPDYASIHRRIPHRTLELIKVRARRLGLKVRSNKAWTGYRERMLKQLSGKIADKEVAAILGTTTPAVRKKRQELALAGRRISTVTGPHRLLMDDVRAQMQRSGATLRSLGNRNKRGFFNNGHLAYAYVGRLVEALGGELHVEWDD